MIEMDEKQRKAFAKAMAELGFENFLTFFAEHDPTPDADEGLLQVGFARSDDIRPIQQSIIRALEADPGLLNLFMESIGLVLKARGESLPDGPMAVLQVPEEVQ